MSRARCKKNCRETRAPQNDSSVSTTPLTIVRSAAGKEPAGQTPGRRRQYERRHGAERESRDRLTPPSREDMHGWEFQCSNRLRDEGAYSAFALLDPLRRIEP